MLRSPAFDQGDDALESIIQKILDNLAKQSISFEIPSITPQPPLQIQCISTFALAQKALKFLHQGYVIVCDDLHLWQELQYSAQNSDDNSDYSLALDWIEKLYRFASTKNLVNAVEMVANPFLKQIDGLSEAVLGWEHLIRKAQVKNLKSTEYTPEHPLAEHLLTIDVDQPFKIIFTNVLELLPGALKHKLLPFSPMIELLDGTPDSLDWFKGIASLNGAHPKIFLGLHEAIKFNPSSVLFCLKNTKIPPLQCQQILKQSGLIDERSYHEALNAWKAKQPINILCHAAQDTFHHPFINAEYPIELFDPPKIPSTFEKPIANPPLGSRPKTISATGFDTLMKDPYGFYARYILELKPLERLANRAFNKEFGITVHEMVEQSLKYGFERGQKFIESLEQSTQQILHEGRLQRILGWVQGQVSELNPLKIDSEKEFKAEVTNAITLKARIDACFTTPKGDLVVNFKTGTPPLKSNVLLGYDPQLAIELFLKMADNNASATQAEFWQLKGTTPPGAVSASLALPANTLKENIEKILSHYLGKQTPFLTCPWPSKTPQYNHYQYLERRF